MRLLVLAWALGIVAQAQTEDADALIERVRQWNQSLNRTAGLKLGRSASAQVRPALRERRDAILRIAARNPRLARELLLPSDAAAELRLAEPDLVERPESYEGPAEVIVADPEDPAGEAVWTYRYYDSTLAVEALQAGSEAPGLSCDSIVRIEGMRLGSRLIVTAAIEIGRAQEAPRCTALGTQRVAVLMVRFPGVAQPPITRDQAAQAFFGDNGRTVRTYYDEGSFGQVKVQGEVFGWYELDRAYTCDESTPMRTAAIRAADADVDFREFDRIYILFTRPAGGCAWLGLGTVGCGNVTAAGDGTFRSSTSWQPVTSNTSGVLTVATHELGHNLGLGHARTLRYPGITAGPDRTQAVTTEYGDRFSTMGNQAVSHHTIAHKIRMGWHDRSAVTEVTEGGEFEIMPLEMPGDGVRGLKVRRNIGAGQWLWIEYRQPIGLFDSAWPANVRPAYGGAIMRLEDSATGISSDLVNFDPAPVASFNTAAGNFVDPTLKPGRVWRDPFSDLSIEVLSVTPERMRIAIQYEPHCLRAPASFTAPGDASELSLAIDAPADCRYSILGNNAWIQPGSISEAAGSGALGIPIAVNPLSSARGGSLTLGRLTISGRQDGRPEPPSVTFVTPSRGAIPRATASAWQVGIRDWNGNGDVAEVHLLVNSGLDPARACYLRVDFAANRFGLMDDEGATFTDQGIAANRTMRNSRCELTYGSRTTVNTFESRLAVSIRFLGAFDEARSVFVKVVDRGGLGTDWAEAGNIAFTNDCAFVPSPGRIVAGSGGTQVSLAIQAPAGCAWTIDASDPWITPAESSGAGTRVLAIAIGANTGDDTRIGMIRIGGVEVPVEQRSAQNPDFAIVTFTPAETTAAAQGGLLSVTVTVNPASFRWTVDPGVDWLRVETIRGGAVSVRAAPNDTGRIRQGWLTIGGRVFGVIQLAN